MRLVQLRHGEVISELQADTLAALKVQVPIGKGWLMGWLCSLKEPLAGGDHVIPNPADEDTYVLSV